MNLDLFELLEDGINDGVSQRKMLMLMADATRHKLDEMATYRKLYHEVYGHTLRPCMCSDMVDNMTNGIEHGRKWSVDQTNDLAKRAGITFDGEYTEHEFNTVVHMMYYDYAKDLKESGVSGDIIFAKMADSYLTDKDAPKGKLVNYFFFVACH